jgi:hypothetical protein
MNKSLQWLAALAFGGVVLAACGGAPTKADLAGFPEDTPIWVKDPGADPRFTDCLAQYGSFRKTGAGFDFQRSQAQMAARASLASEIEARIRKAVDSVHDVAGSDVEAESVASESRRLVQELTQLSVMGARQRDLWVNPGNGELFVLVAVDARVVSEALREQQGLWDRYQARLTRDELDGAIRRAFPGPPRGNSN